MMMRREITKLSCSIFTSYGGGEIKVARKARVLIVTMVVVVVPGRGVHDTR
jgi:hypothetical protein